MVIINRARKCAAWINVSLALALMSGTSMANPQIKQIFDQNCAACHQLENIKDPIVGPSLVEIAHLYKDDLAGFVKWCNEPGKKRNDAIDMPSMVHVGDKNLGDIHAWILEATKGKRFLPGKVKSGDLYGLDFSKLDGPIMQRIFMSDSSPASIAVSIDGKHSLCWDTVSCRMRYAWYGGYIDGFPYWERNGNAFAKVLGEIYYRAPAGLVSSLKIEGIKEAPKFKGYKMLNGLPIFSYTIGSVAVSESILNKEGSLVIQIKLQGNESVVSYPLGDLEKTQFSYSAGKIVDGALVLDAKESAEFELTFNLKK